MHIKNQLYYISKFVSIATPDNYVFINPVSIKVIAGISYLPSPPQLISMGFVPNICANRVCPNGMLLNPSSRCCNRVRTTLIITQLSQQIPRKQKGPGGYRKHDNPPGFWTPFNIPLPGGTKATPAQRQHRLYVQCKKRRGMPISMPLL